MIFLISDLLARISNPQKVIREVFIGKKYKDFGILSFKIKVREKFI